MDELDGHGLYASSGDGMPRDHQSDELRDIVASIPNGSEILKSTVESPASLKDIVLIADNIQTAS